MSPPLKTWLLCAAAASICVLAAIFWFTWQQAEPSEQGMHQTHISRQMDRLSSELEERDQLKEWPDARRATSHSGYVLVTTTQGYVGGDRYEEYFALFSGAPTEKNDQAPALIGWAMVPAPFRFEDHAFAVETNAAGEKRLRLSLAGNSGEPPTPSVPEFVEYLLPGRDAWGIELGK